VALSLTARLRESTGRRPDALAVIQRDRRVAYDELWAQTAALAGFLTREGLRPGERVAILIENSPEYIAAYYGALAAGGAAVALNTAARAADLVNWIGHCAASWLIADAAHPELAAVRERLPAETRLVTLGGQGEAGSVRWEEIQRAGGSPLPSEAADEALGAIIYTSGTTGRPKGVMLSRRNLAANVQSILDYLHIEPADRAMNVLPFYYSYGNSVLHTHLAVGASLVLENNLVYPHQVLAQMAMHRVTSFAGVPSTYALLLNRTKLGDYDLTSLRYMTQAGGAMPPAVIRRLRDALPHVQLFVMYGQTEATARLTYLPPERLETKLGSAGVAIPGVTIEVRSEGGRVLPPGQVGEICARGDNIMLGYWGDPQAGAAVLRDGWLHTGDMASRDADGFLFIQGRRSDMIKTGAHRVHPGEIEEVIAELEDVADVAVVGVDDEILGQVIKAVIVPRAGRPYDPMQVKAHCRERLATYKIPKFIEYATELPRTASGKVKRYLLAG
jgi:acyl-CoA synthetase (AMP-forming)/AMP-acid ligase II